MGEFLFRLHFMAQLNQVPIRVGIAPFGYLIAGITAFIFLFALITGLLLHWDKIVSNFSCSDRLVNGKRYGPICIRHWVLLVFHFNLSLR
jgi:hypothetical protein